MSEQIYMKLEDKVNRPTFDIKKINVNHPRFKKMVDDYVHWNDDLDYKVSKREEYENDIRSCLDEYDLDGYNLAEHLKVKVGIDPDADLVELLDNAFRVKEAIVNEVIKNWVKENFLKIPYGILGKKVNSKSGWRKLENYYITSIRPETYEVTINEDAKKEGGYIVGFENVTFID